METAVAAMILFLHADKKRLSPVHSSVFFVCTPF